MANRPRLPGSGTDAMEDVPKRTGSKSIVPILSSSLIPFTFVNTPTPPVKSDSSKLVRRTELLRVFTLMRNDED